MAWPLSRLVDFFANSVPVIAEVFLEAVEDAVIWIYTGAKTLKKLQIDGTGGAATSVSDGDLAVSGGVKVAKLVAQNGPHPIAQVPAGYVGIGKTVHGWANVASAGTLARGANVKSVTRVALGQYRIVFFEALTNNNFMFPLWCSLQSGRRCDYASTQQAGTDVQLDMWWVDGAGAAADADFACGLVGE